MSQLSNYAEETLLNHIFRGVALAFPASWHIALFTADPTEAGGGAEVSTGVWTNYARVALARGAVDWAAAVAEGGGGFESTNAILIDFGIATIVGAAPVITHVAIKDAAAAGNVWWYGALGSAKTVNNGDAINFPIGDLAAILR